ncbi:unnamed protein product, partial [Prorocentrum cordatum]
MPATEVQRIAAAAYKDGLRHGEISRLAALGQRGNYPGNIHQQLNTMLGRNSLPQPMVLEIPCVDPKTSEVALADCGVLLPHEWFSALFHRYETEFNYIFGVDRLGEFWANASRLHGDGAEFLTRDSLVTLGVTGLLAVGSTKSLTLNLTSWPLSLTAK